MADDLAALLARSDLCVNVKQPHACSSSVAFVSSNRDVLEEPIAVVKFRDEVEEVVMEQFNYLCSCEMGFNIVAPCLGTSREVSAAATHAPLSLAEHLDALQLQRCGPGPYNAVIEACQKFISPSWRHKSQESPLARVVDTLNKSCPSGCLDLCQATLGSPSGAKISQLFDEDPQQQLGISDSDVKVLVDALCYDSFERLCLFAALTCQIDISPENVMLRAVTDNDGGARVELVLIDTGCAWPDFDELELELCEDEEELNTYWFPAMLFLPHAEKALTPRGIALLNSITPDGLRKVVQKCAAACQSRLYIPTAKLVPAADAVDRAVQRLLKMQRAVQADPSISLLRLSFIAVPAWARDWPMLEGTLGMESYMTLVATGKVPLKAQLFGALPSLYNALATPQIACLFLLTVTLVVARYRMSRR